MISSVSSFTKRAGLLLVSLGLVIAGCAGEIPLLGSGEDSAGKNRVTGKVYAPQAIDHVILASLYETQGDYVRAIHEFNQALLYDSSSATIYHSIAENYERLGESESAERILARALSKLGPDQRLLRYYGELQYKLERYPEALKTFETLVDRYPDDRDGWYNLASLYIRAGNQDKAIKCYDRVIELEGPKVEVIARQATLLMLAEEYEEAIAAYRKMQEIRPNDAMVPYTIGRLFLETSDTTRADSAFSAAILLDPKEFSYWAARISVAAIQDDTLKVLDLVGSSLRHLGENSEGFALAGSIYMKYELYRTAEEVFRKALEIDSVNTDHHLNLGYLYHEISRWDDAEKVYARAMAIDPEDPQILNNFAYLLAVSERRLDEALLYVDKALKSAPETPSYLDTKGWVLYRMGKYEEALKLLEKAALRDANNAEIFDHLGDTYRALDQLERARSMWSRSLEINKNQVKIREKLDQ